MQSDSYKPADVVPWETASGSKAVVCDRPSACTLTTTFNNAPGEYKIAVKYFDLNTGSSTYDLQINNKTVAQWTANLTLPSGKLDGHTSTRYTLDNIHLAPGDTITLRGIPQAREPAPVDYIEITPVPKL